MDKLNDDIREIKKLLERFNEGGKEEHGDRTRHMVGFEVLDNSDTVACISALLEVCYLALDGNGSFVPPKHGSNNKVSSVAKALEMAIDLLPHDRMYCLDRIADIMANEREKGMK